MSLGMTWERLETLMNQYPDWVRALIDQAAAEEPVLDDPIGWDDEFDAACPYDPETCCRHRCGQ